MRTGKILRQSRGEGYFKQGLFGVFTDTKNKAAEPSHGWPGTSLLFQGYSSGRAALWPSPEAGFLEEGRAEVTAGGDSFQLVLCPLPSGRQGSG